jgi:hypothetical protein
MVRDSGGSAVRSGRIRTVAAVEESQLPKPRRKASNVLFPTKSLDESTSNLTALVNSDGENFFEFELAK